MIRKYWILIVTVALSAVSFAQNCTPDNSIVTTGVYPTVSQGFKNGTVGVPYEQTAQVKVIEDTVIDFQGSPTSAKVLYALIDSVVGMPTGFQYACNTQDCKIVGGGVGCTSMYGTPILADEGKEFVLTIYTTLYGLPTAWLGLGLNPIPFPVEFDDYSVSIDSDINSANVVSPITNSKVYPNPSESNFKLELNSSRSEGVEISFTNLLGARISVTTTVLNVGVNTFEYSGVDLQPGIYMLTIIGDFGKEIHKVILK